ncbi:BZIP domain-containing protein [Aphelenchoides bicaudatus]|nr:BZIP domain-containing protein [Aphelenchoides bicaudatus]
MFESLQRLQTNFTLWEWHRVSIIAGSGHEYKIQSERMQTTEKILRSMTSAIELPFRAYVPAIFNSSINYQPPTNLAPLFSSTLIKLFKLHPIKVIGHPNKDHESRHHRNAKRRLLDLLRRSVHFQNTIQTANHLMGILQQVGERPHSLLGSLLASSSARRSPSVPESRTEKQSGLVDQQQQLLQRLEQAPQQQKPTGCLTSLAVSLHGQPISQNGVCGRSDNDSMGSPHSTRSTTDSNRSHGSPSLGSHGQDGGDATQTSSTNEGPLDKRLEHERYIDRRRRNNEAAKRCRANRRAVFEYRSKRAQQLEAENSDLRQEMIKLNSELEHLKAVIAANNRLVQA